MQTKQVTAYCLRSEFFEWKAFLARRGVNNPEARSPTSPSSRVIADIGRRAAGIKEQGYWHRVKTSNLEFFSFSDVGDDGDVGDPGDLLIPAIPAIAEIY